MCVREREREGEGERERGKHKNKQIKSPLRAYNYLFALPYYAGASQLSRKSEGNEEKEKKDTNVCVVTHFRVFRQPQPYAASSNVHLR